MPFVERNLTVLERSYVKPIHIVQNTNLVDFNINITDWNIPADSVVYWQVTNGDEGELNLGALNGNTIIITPYSSTFQKAGESHLQIRIERENRTLVSFEIPVYVESDRVTGGQEGYNSDVIGNLVEQYVEDATEGIMATIELEAQRIIDSIPSDYTELEARVDELESNALKLVRLTQAQYDALSSKDSNTLYLIEEA